MKKFKFSLIPTVLSIGIILAVISVIAYYFIYQDSIVLTAVNNSRAALEIGQLQTAISDLSNVDTRTYADNELVQAQEVAIQNFENISKQYNDAINDMNASNYPECISILKSLHTDNTYLTQRINNTLSIANTGYAQLLYKEGIEALQSENSQAASTCYSTLLSNYPNSPFTKQLEAYLNGTAKGTLHSLNIEISRPTILPIGATPTPAPQTVQVIAPSNSENATTPVANTTPVFGNSNTQNQNTNSNSISNTSSNSNSTSNSINQTASTTKTPDVSTTPRATSNTNPHSDSGSSSSHISSTKSEDNAPKQSQDTPTPPPATTTTTNNIPKN